MRYKVLIAGIGNIFFGDDGFGVEVARELAQLVLPAGIKVVDFGIRSLHLAFELLTPPELLILVDVARRGGPPGTLYVIEPHSELEAAHHAITGDAHGMNLHSLFTSLEAMGGHMPRTRILGCEPGSLGEGMQLSPQVQRAVRPAIDLIRRLIAREVPDYECA
ncbi:MAG TPA: hydrogenase maturation protease [Polyangiaceae bacterium]|jgi:hydrogenase maturation protease